MSKKSKFRLTTGMLVVASMLCITACGGKEAPQVQNSGTTAIEYSKNAEESAVANLGEASIDEIKEQLTSLMNMRFTGDYSIVEKTTCLSDGAKAEIKSVIEASDSQYLDITDIYDENYNQIKDQVEEMGGTVHEDGSITYDSLEGLEEPTAGLEEPTAGLEEPTAGFVEEPEIPNEPETIPAESLESLEESTEALEESTEALEETFIAGEEEEYYGGGEPVGTNEEGYFVDADGNILIPGGTSGIHPMSETLMDNDGNVYWEGISDEQELENLTNEDKIEYFKAKEAWASVIMGDSNKAQEYLNAQEEVLETDVDREDGLGDSENPVESIFDRPTHMSEFGETSEYVKIAEDGTKYIEWRDVINGYDPQNGLFTYMIFGFQQQVDFSKTYIPVNAMDGDSRYEFILMDWRALDNGNAIFNFESKTSQDGMGYTVEVRGTIKDGVFTPENTKRFTEFYL